MTFCNKQIAIFFSALAVWMAWESTTRCQANLEAARESKVSMQNELNKIKKFKTDMDDGYAQVREVRKFLVLENKMVT